MSQQLEPEEDPAGEGAEEAAAGAFVPGVNNKFLHPTLKKFKIETFQAKVTAAYGNFGDHNNEFVQQLHKIRLVYTNVTNCPGRSVAHCHHCIYIIFHMNKYNNRVYIGQTSKFLMERFNSHVDSAAKESAWHTSKRQQMYRFFRQSGMKDVWVFPLEIIRDGYTKNDGDDGLPTFKTIALPREQFWYDAFKRQGYRLYNLCRPSVNAATAENTPPLSTNPSTPLSSPNSNSPPPPRLLPPSSSGPSRTRTFISHDFISKIQDLHNKLNLGIFSSGNISYFTNFRAITLRKLLYHLSICSSSDLGISKEKITLLLKIIGQALAIRHTEKPCLENPLTFLHVPFVFRNAFESFQLRQVLKPAKSLIPPGAEKSPLLTFQLKKPVRCVLINTPHIASLSHTTLQHIFTNPCSCSSPN